MQACYDQPTVTFSLHNSIKVSVSTFPLQPARNEKHAVVSVCVLCGNHNGPSLSNMR